MFTPYAKLKPGFPETSPGGWQWAREQRLAAYSWSAPLACGAAVEAPSCLQ